VSVRPLGTPPGGPISVKAAYPQVTAAVAPIYVAADQGFFDQNGLRVELSQVTGPNQVAALGTGELQFGVLGANEVSNADAGGADLVMVATVSDYPIFSLYAQPKYASIQELAGQAIGVTGPGTATDAAAHLFLRHFNLEGQVTITPSGGSVPGILAAMTQGAIAGGILSPPTTAQAAAQGMRELVNGVTLGIPMNHDVVAVSRTFLQSNRDAVTRFLTAYQQAWTFCSDDANQPAVVAALVTYTKSSEADARAGYDAVKPVYATKSVPDVGIEGVRTILDLAASPAARNADPTRWIDNSIIDGIAGR
jgi:ABC-type nitrate/sulfonate/bicarbonate transport system substrate-binding protein